MSKKDRTIKALQTDLERKTAVIEALRVANQFAKNEAAMKKANEEFAAATRRKDEKLANISNGLIPVDDLRALIVNTRADYEPNVTPRTTIEIVIAEPNLVQKAILNALTPNRPNFSVGGYTGGRYDARVLGDFADSTIKTPVELSPSDRQLLADAIKRVGGAR